MWPEQGGSSTRPSSRTRRLRVLLATHAGCFQTARASLVKFRQSSPPRSLWRQELPEAWLHPACPCNCHTQIPAAQCQTGETLLPSRAYGAVLNRRARRPYRRSRLLEWRTARRSRMPTLVRLGLGIVPIEKLPPRRAAMAVVRLLFRAQLGKRFLNLWKVKQRIISKTIRAARTIKNHTFRRPAKSRKCLAIAGCRKNPTETPGALL